MLCTCPGIRELEEEGKEGGSGGESGTEKTGGGSFEPKIDSTAEKLLAMLGNRAKPLSNPFDCDAEYNNDAGKFNYHLLCSCSICEQVLLICNRHIS